MSILIVEDNPVSARLLTLILTGQGYQTVVAKNGKEALTTVASISDLQLIITDYMMPEMDGLAFIAAARALPALHLVPILIASAHGDLETIKQVQGLQCQGFLLKPIDSQQLLKRVEHLIGSQPRVLVAQHTIMTQLNIGLEEYHELVKIFMRQLADIIPILVVEQKDSDEPIPESLGRALEYLAEGATLLGAEKFVRLYAKSAESGQRTRSYCSVLLSALREVDLILSSYMQSQQKSAATD